MAEQLRLDRGSIKAGLVGQALPAPDAAGREDNPVGDLSTPHATCTTIVRLLEAVMFERETMDEITEVANEFGLESAALLAVAEVECGGQAFAMVGDRKEPLIRFEGHYFDRRLSPDKQAQARQLGLSSPEAGAIANPPSQAARWALLRRAMAIDAKAAAESTSWGLGQVMGAHWAWLGYADVDALVRQARSGAAGQARLMARYVVKAGLGDALARRDWATFARGYNGPGYRANRYDLRLAQAFARHSGGAASSSANTLLRPGDRGEVIRDIQLALSAAGYPLAIDGMFGPATAQAVRHFQREHGLAADGVVGPLTRQGLRDALSLPARLRFWWTRLLD